MKLACADFTWPLLPHDRVLKLINLLDIEGVDLGLFGNQSHIRPEVVRYDIPMWSGILKERLAQSGLERADFFITPWTDYETMAPNNPHPKQQEDVAAFFRDMLDMALSACRINPSLAIGPPVTPTYHKCYACS
jgi:hypothetical protein